MSTHWPFRIVIVSSLAHEAGTMHWDDLNWEKSYNKIAAYSQSKLANVLHAKELAKQLENDGISVYSLHPGIKDLYYSSYLACKVYLLLQVRLTLSWAVTFHRPGMERSCGL